MTTTDVPVVSVRNLRVTFAGTQVVHGVDLDIHAGECVAVVGESGSGKSVTARSLIGLTGQGARVAADRLDLQGEDLRGASESRWRKVRGAGVGYVLQDALVSLDPLRRIGREIEDALRLHTRQPARRRREAVLQLLEDVGIPEPGQRVRQRSGELSGGLRQRALIASAIALRPPVLVADEPTTALDATVQQQILDLLGRLKDQGSALLLISHDLAVVAHMADRIAVMRAGEIVEHGRAQQVLHDPQHDYTRRLLRAVPTDRPRGTALADAPVTVSPRRQELVAARRAGGPTVAGPVLVGEGLRKVYRNPDGSPRVAVDDVSFALAPGTTLGVVGESGSGKTTVARMALGLVRPDAGEVRLLGRPWSVLPEKARRPHRHHVAAIYQDALGSFDPRWSVGQILDDALIGADGLSRGDRRDEVAELLGTVGLSPDVARRSPRRLSGGQRQRIAIARALASGPDVIVCDEPVSALDVSIQAQVLDLLDELQRRLGLSYLFISHDLGVVRHVSDEIVVMAGGRVVETGTSEEIFANPTQEYTRRLLSAAPRLETPALKGLS
ncbi:dipeptide ABC transporter ATP-binding protein [Georgenia sp. AZ-5]|uniref:dipeptide ABC transporter ATP-binding protein n=1 Tax=Georgenia sp. AZ-5 TaxID=3367526 RepID=UPI0037553117